MFINCGVYIDGQRPKTKGELKAAANTLGLLVQFDQTSTMLQNYPSRFSREWFRHNHNGVYLQVCGPHPHRERKWYATVYIKDGLVKIT